MGQALEKWPAWPTNGGPRSTEMGYIMQEALQEGRRLFLENPGKEALKKEEELQASQMRAEGNISHFIPCLYYSIHP